MEILDETEKMFNAYFKILKHQPTKNPESNSGIFVLVEEYLQCPAHIDDDTKKLLSKNGQIFIFLLKCVQ